MRRRDESPDWMWSNALATLDRMEQVHRQIFQLRAARTPTWEPPVDVLVTERELLIYVALPGVDAREVKAVIDGATLVVSGRRVLPASLQHAAIHRLELPQGRFERHVPLPAGRYAGSHVSSERGCLVISLEKAA